jgi:hypothetical protein
MKEPFSIEFHGTYVHILHQPGFVASLDAVEDMWARFAEICDEYDCRKVLVEAPDPTQRLDTMTAFDAGRGLAKINPGITVAFSLPGYDPDDVSTFFKTVAQNRGVEIEYFSNADDAREWLTDAKKRL